MNPAEYCTTTEPEKRAAIRGAVIEAHRDSVARLVARLVPADCRAEGEQIGAIGVLVALEKYGPEKGSFWIHAGPYVRAEIGDWLDRGVCWRPREDGPEISDSELRGRLFEFVAERLSDEERAILFSERERRDGTRRHLKLVERAVKYLRGEPAKKED